MMPHAITGSVPATALPVGEDRSAVYHAGQTTVASAVNHANVKMVPDAMR